MNEYSHILYESPLLYTTILAIATSDSGPEGETGSLRLTTGKSSAGGSGNITIATGEASYDNHEFHSLKRSGAGGNIDLKVGSNNYGDGKFHSIPRHRLCI